MPQSDSKTKMLLIDDDPSIVRLLDKVINRSFGDKITLESMTDPIQAKVRLQEGGTDILLSDLEMPGINGLELLRCAKHRSFCTQVLFLTGHSSQKALLEALEMGAMDYLLKPVDQEELLNLLSQAHDRILRWRGALAETWQKKRSETLETTAG